MVVRFLKFIVALALMPLVAAEVWTLIGLAWRLIPAGQSPDAWFISFAAGFITWLVAFALLPRTLWLYVLGHEFTHALAAMLAGGKVTAFKVTSKGGHVITDRVSWWISLSPYFVPIYALIWMALWLTVDFYYSLAAYQPVLYFGVGLFWAFHLTFTLSMMNRQQTDLSREGFVFSGVVILFFNLLAFLLLLTLLSHDFTLAGNLFWQRICRSYEFAWDEMDRALDWMQLEWRRPRS